MRIDQGLGSVSEERKHIVVDLLKVRDDLTGGCSDDILRLRDSDPLELDASLALDLLDQHLRLAGVEGDGRSRCSSSCSSAGSVDVGLCLLGWLDLDDEVDIGDVESS